MSIRTFIHYLVVFTLLFVSAQATAATVRDTFSTQLYTNNNGTENWSSNWVEGGTGSDTSASAGLIRIENNRLEFRGVNGPDPFITRSVDLAGVGDAILTFDVGNSGNLETNDTWVAEVASSAAGPFRVLETFTGNASGPRSYNITPEASATTTIRLRVVVNIIGGGEFGFFDNVTVTYPGSADADLSLALDADSADAAYGQLVNYELSLSNAGQSAATNVTFTQSIPTGFDFTLGDASVTTGTATLAYNGGTRILTVVAPNVPVQQNAIVVEVPMTSRARGNKTSVAQITAADQSDFDSSPNNDDGDQSEDDEDSITVDFPDFSAVCIPDNPQAHWAFDSNTNDSTANGHNANGGSVTYSTSDFLLGTASAEFGATTGLNYSDGQFLNYRFTEMSVSLFIKPNNLSGTKYIFDEGGTTNGISLRMNGSNVEAAVRESNVQETLSATFPNDGAWHHVAMTYDNGDFSFYFDGSLVGTIPTGFGELADHGNIGGVGDSRGGTAFGSGNGSDAFDGKIDHVSYYNRALSAGDISSTALCGLGLQPTVEKTFFPSIINAGDSTQLRFVVDNPNSSPATNVSFTDNMPASIWLDSLTVSTTGSCTGFSVSGSTSIGDSSFTIEGGTVPAGQSCTLSIPVRSNVPGTFSNQTEPVTSTSGGQGRPSTVAQLTVTDPGTAVCTPASTGSGAILMNYENDIYSVDLLTAKANLITSVPNITNVNALATDPRNYLIYYTDNNSVASNTALRAYDILNDTHFVVEANLTNFGVTVGASGLGSSGNTFYNGSLYIGVEDLDLAYRVVMADDGRSVRYATQILQLPAAHDFGDFVAANGKLYDFDRGADRFKRYDLATLTLELDVAAPFATQGGAQRNGDSLWSVGDNLATVSATTGALDGGFNQPITIDGTNPIPGTPFDAGGCVVTTSRVGDLIWNDSNGDGVKDSNENGIGGVTVALYWDLNGNGTIDSGETDIRATATTASDGIYNFDLLIPGDYIVRVTDTANVLAGATPTNNGGSNDRAFAGTINTQIDNIDFGYQSFIVLEGRVFDDDGNGGGTAHNAIRESNEVGFEQLEIRVTDPNNGDAVIVSGFTGADGVYRLRVPNSFAASPITISADTPAGFISISESVGTTGATNTDTRDDVIVFTPTASTTYQNLNFGDVRLDILTPNNSKTVQPGQTVDYAHTFTSGTLGTVSFDSQATASPNLSGWQHAVYQDTDCSSSLSSAEVNAGPLSASNSFSVINDQKICLIVRVFSPSAAPPSARYVVDLTSDFVYLNETPDGLTDSLTVSDLTTVAAAGLALSKFVENITLGGSRTDNNTARPGHTLRYTIGYINNSASPIDQVVVRDSTPAYTSLAGPIACPASLPAALSSCTVIIPSAGNNMAGYEGAIEWSLSGNLNPGQAGELQYQILVD